MKIIIIIFYLIGMKINFHILTLYFVESKPIL